MQEVGILVRDRQQDFREVERTFQRRVLLVKVGLAAALGVALAALLALMLP